MLVLVATRETQGDRDNDFCFVPEGELVRWGTECSGATVDDYCGCRRSMVGFDCHKATTTMKVVDVDITPEEYVAKYKQSLVDCGLMMSQDGVVADALDLSDEAEELGLGTIVERRDELQRRVSAEIQKRPEITPRPSATADYPDY